MAETGAYLVIRSYAPDAQVCRFADAVSAQHKPVGAARLHEVEALEPGSLPAHTLIIPFADKDAARAAYAEMPKDLIAAPKPPLVLLTGAVPAAGFDDPSIPTQANAANAVDDGPVLLLIEGSASDQDAMDQYRDIILPMMFDLKSYYTVFDLGGAVEVLSGEWDEAIFAISRWPSREAARAFWLSERYQRDAIPLRLNIGRFEVVAIPEV